MSDILAVGSQDDNIYIYDTANFSLQQTLTDSSDNILNLAYSDNYLAASSRDDIVYIYNTGSYSLETTLTEASSGNNSVGDITLSSNGDYVAYADGINNNIYVHNTSDFSLQTTLTDAGSDVRSLEFGPNNDYLISVDDNNTFIYNQSDFSLQTTITDSSRFINDADFKPDGSQFALADGGNDNVYIYDTSDFSLENTISVNGSITFTVSYISDHIAVSTTGNGTFIYDTTNYNQQENLTDTTNPASDGFNSDGSLLAIGSFGNDNVYIYDTSDFSLQTTLTDSTNSVEDAVFSKSTKTLTGIDTTLASNELLIDETTNVTVTANFDDGSSSDVTSDATITSNDTSIATVSNSTVTPQDFGSTTIQADYNGNTDTAPLDVVQDIVMSTLRVGNVTEDDAVLYGEITQRNDSTIGALNVGFDYKKTANNTYQSIDAESVNLDNISFPYEYSVFLDNLDSGSNYEFRAFGEEP